MKNNGIMKETFDVLELLYESYIKDNYTIGQNMANVNKVNLDIVLKDFEKFIFPVNLKSDVIYYKNEQCIVIENRTKEKDTSILDIYATDIKYLETIYNEIFDKCIKDSFLSEIVSINFHKFTYGSRGSLKISQEKIDAHNFKGIMPEYYPSLDINMFMTEFFTRKESLLILNGLSGTGKTKFSSLILKYASENYHLIEDYNSYSDDEEFEDILADSKKEIKVAYVKNEDILHSEEFWIALSENKYDFVLLDDLDYMLIPRERNVSSQIDIDKAKFISQLLSFTDGVVPTNTKFIITSNKGDSDVDSALMRPGRLFDILNFKPLTKAEAKVIWIKNGLAEDIFPFTTDHILAAELGSSIDLLLKNSTISLRGYLKDKTISSAKKEKTNKIGF